MSATQGGPAPRSGRAVVGLVVAAVLSLAALAGAGLAGYRAVHADSTAASHWKYVALAGVAVVAMLVLVRLVMHAEHQLRDSASQPGCPADASLLTSLAVGNRAARRYAPLTLTALGLIYLAACAGLVVATVTTEGAASKSQYVQQNGLPAVGRVLSDVPIVHDQLVSSYTTSEIHVRLRRVVAGTRDTTVYDPTSGALVGRAGLAVLVDPNEPSYAELANTPFVDRFSWVYLALAAAVAGALSVLMLASRVKLAGRAKKGVAAAASVAVAAGQAGAAGTPAAATGTVEEGSRPFGAAVHAASPTREQLASRSLDGVSSPATPSVAPAGTISPAGTIAAEETIAAGETIAAEETVSSGAHSARAGSAGAPAVAADPGPATTDPRPAIVSGSVGDPRPAIVSGSVGDPGSAGGPEPAVAPAVQHGEHPAVWHDDPYGRYRLRYWDGTAWTEWVSDGSGATSSDPLTLII